MNIGKLFRIFLLLVFCYNIGYWGCIDSTESSLTKQQALLNTEPKKVQNKPVNTLRQTVSNYVADAKAFLADAGRALFGAPALARVNTFA